MIRFNRMESILFNCPEYSVMTLYTVPNTHLYLFLPSVNSTSLLEKCFQCLSFLKVLSIISAINAGILFLIQVGPEFKYNRS